LFKAETCNDALPRILISAGGWFLIVGVFGEKVMDTSDERIANLESRVERLERSFAAYVESLTQTLRTRLDDQAEPLEGDNVNEIEICSRRDRPPRDVVG
jgi:hypothetical protein